ncbi:MAG: hypothetical protein RIQ81_1857 [Pseudomonadota bacterium]|jgi:hypothetical protein
MKIHSIIMPVEAEALLRSTDALLRGFANELTGLASRAHREPSQQGLKIMTFAPPGGGAAEFSRHLAILSCMGGRAHLYPIRNPPVEATALPVSLFGPVEEASDLTVQGKAVCFCFTEDRDVPGLAAVQGWRVLKIPPLAARPGDALLAAEIMARNFFPPGLKLANDALELIHDFRWPGELAHLRVTLGVAAQLAFSLGRPVVDAAQILDVLRRKERNLAWLCRLDHSGWSFPISGRDLLQLATFTGFSRVRKALELLLIEGAVASAGGNSSTAARRLGLPYTTLVSRQKVLSQKRTQER